MADRWRTVLLTWSIGLIGTASVSTHHSVAGQFDPSQPLTLTGVVSKVDWVNPHIYVYLDVADEQGVVTTWTWETVPTAMARRAGLTRESFLGAGKPVTIEGIAGRKADLHLGFVYKITFADGRYVQLSAPR